MVWHVLRGLKEELALATYKRFSVNSNINCYTSKEIKKRVILSFQKILFTLLCGP